jgi:hypothetical protein
VTMPSGNADGKTSAQNRKQAQRQRRRCSVFSGCPVFGATGITGDWRAASTDHGIIYVCPQWCALLGARIAYLRALPKVQEHVQPTNTFLTETRGDGA